MIHIIIPVHNRLELTKKCIESLERQNVKDIAIYIVDDGSNDGTFEWLSSKKPLINYIKGNGSLWWTGSVFKGIELAKTRSKRTDYVMTLNNDVLVKKDTIENLLYEIKKSPNIILGALSLADDKDATIISSGAKMISWVLNISYHPFYGKRINEIKTKSVTKVDMLTGRCVIYPMSLFFSGFYFDYKNFPHYGGDNEFTSRIKKNGYELGIVPKAFVVVKRSETGLNPIDRKLSVAEKIASLYSIKSVNNLAIRAKFAFSVPPWYARPTYFLISLLKIMIQLLLGNILIYIRNFK